MQKDVIYIDTEDDITAIISKIKASKSKIVALVPPKRIGAIQSAVNLKLVHRIAEQSDKRLVIISNNEALIALAATASIPVAKNLQSKPELAEVPALEIDDGDDVIDGGSLASAPTPIGSPDKSDKSNLDSDKNSTDSPKLALGATALSAGKKMKKPKIPDFDIFRKNLFLIVTGVVALVAFLVWAIIYAPSADITVFAKTSDANLSTQVKLGDGLTTDLKNSTIKTVTKSTKKDISEPFDATGSKNVGEKATGKVKFTKSTPGSVQIPAGVILTVSGMNFVLDNDVNVPSATLDWSCGGVCPSSTTGTITAQIGGSSYNGASGSVSGAPSTVTASMTAPTSGGTDKTITVVQQSDVDAVKGNIVSSSDSDTAKKALIGQFGKDYTVLDTTFKVNADNIKPNPAVDAEASSGKGTLVGSVTFTMVGVPKSELSKFFKTYFEQQVDGKNSQKVYDDGIGSASFTNVNAVDGGFSANVTANGKLGPQIDESALKNFAKGKRLGEIQDHINRINGVDDVNIKFSPFWVNSAPNDVKRIHVEFKINGKA